MLLDVISQYGYLQVNVKLANVAGLNVAAYWAELLNVYARVINKKMEQTVSNQGFFDLDREYVTRRTTLSLEEQALCDKALAGLEVLERSESDPNSIRLDINRMSDILVSDDPKELEKLAKVAKAKRSDSRTAKREAMKRSLKAAVIDPDRDLVEAYWNWIDSIMDSGNYLSKAMVEAFVKTVREFSDAKEAQLKVIEIAMIQCYKNAAWAINSFQKDYKNMAVFLNSQPPKKKNGEIDPDSAF